MPSICRGRSHIRRRTLPRLRSRPPEAAAPDLGEHLVGRLEGLGVVAVDLLSVEDQVSGGRQLALSPGGGDSESARQPQRQDAAPGAVDAAVILAAGWLGWLVELLEARARNHI